MDGAVVEITQDEKDLLSEVFDMCATEFSTKDMLKLASKVGKTGSAVRSQPEVPIS